MNIFQAKEPTELKSVNVLSWQQKHKLAIGIGDALSYLHDCFKSAVVVKRFVLFLV